CETFPTHLLRKIQVVLKVGAADHWSRTEGQLNSVIKCIANVMVVSDLSHPYGTEHEAMDVLADLPAESYLKEEDYQIYDHQRNVSIGEGKLKQGHEGWKIDKYKFLPEVEKAVGRNTDAEWYVFLESDTYIFWDNMFRLLENYDHSEPYYFGSPSPGRGIPDSEDHIWFAYGGCGFVLSNAAAHRLVDRKRNNVGIKGPRLSEEYKEDIQRDCCGDSMLGWAIYDKAGVTLSGLWPMFNPHSLAGLPFGKHYWCEPVISLHKTAASEFQKLWKWENSRDRSNRPLLYADLLAYHHLGTFSRREDWDAADLDGFTEPDDHPAHTSLDACDAACKENAQCYQFTWHGKHCYMARSIRLGHHKKPDGKHAEEDRRYVSGWDVGKIERWKEEHKCAEGAHWVKPSLERIF
ncbi:family 31 glycosyltransferase, partial [Corynespora cassiicola Philippines]